MPRITAELTERLEQMVPRQRHHECIYPVPDGEGTPGAAVQISTDADDNSHGGGTSTRDYWGETASVLGTNVVDTVFFFQGCYITLFSAAEQDNVFTVCFYVVDEDYWNSEKDGGLDWDEGATVLTVADGSKFQADDLVWIFSSTYMDGEMQRVTDVAGNVVTVEREAMAPGWGASTGLRWNHSTDGSNETMYLAYRPSWTIFHSHCITFESGSSRRTDRFVWASAKTCPANSGIVARVQQATDDDDDRKVEVKIFYDCMEA